ncbi:MAG: hypothetical protein PHW32_04235 [Bacilli bacterium]|nr:hypothetical protein [Bacilli bacterium]MDD4718481.1 hypothetical protein [Bacilli bacterium]
MKKIMIVLIGIILLSGCTVVRIDTKSIDNIVSVVLSKDNKLFNQIGKGYKYYIPRGVNYLDTTELNNKLYSKGNYYYLYIDVISYYHDKKIEYQVDENAYYSSSIDINGKTGYLEINKIDDEYFVEFMYNYAKIESLVAKNDIEDVVLDASYILSTIKFNNNVIKLMLNSDFFTNREEKYDIFTSKKETTNFLQYEEEEIINE